MKLRDYAAHDALGLAALVKNGEVTADELLTCALEAAEALNGDLNAVVRSMEGEARAAIAAGPKVKRPPRRRGRDGWGRGVQPVRAAVRRRRPAAARAQEAPRGAAREGAGAGQPDSGGRGVAAGPLTAALLAWLGLAAHAGCPGCAAGTVGGIVDGDTLDVGGVRVRLALVDAPEAGEPGHAEAAAFAAAACPPGSEAAYDPDSGQPGGSHGRVVAEVFCGGSSLNGALVLGGHAETMARHCGASEFSSRPWSGCPGPLESAAPYAALAAAAALAVTWAARSSRRGGPSRA